MVSVGRNGNEGVFKGENGFLRRRCCQRNLLTAPKVEWPFTAGSWRIWPWVEWFSCQMLHLLYFRRLLHSAGNI